MVLYTRTAEPITRFLAEKVVDIAHNLGLKIRNNAMRNSHAEDGNKNDLF